MATRFESELNIDQLAREDRVHTRIYADPAIFALEMERIFGRTWVYIAHESEIAHGGDYKSTYIGQQPVIVTRNADDDQVYVLFNRCRHRAATVCQREGGNANYFRCAYHGWTYNNRGELVGVTYRQGYGPEFNYGEMGLVRVPRVASYRGFIFASLNPAVMSLEDWLGDTRQYLDHFIDQSPEGEIALSAGAQRIGYRGNWKLQLENSVDNYHVSFVHQSETERRMRQLRAEGISAQAVQTPDKRNRVRSLANGHGVNDFVYHLPGGPGAAEPTTRRHINLEIFPNLQLVNVEIRVIRPLTVNQTELLIYPMLLKGVPEAVNAARLRGHEGFYGPAGFGQPDDLEMFNRIQIGLQAHGNDWVVVSRGLADEETDARGVVSSAPKNETGVRGIYAQWKRMMAE